MEPSMKILLVLLCIGTYTKTSFTQTFTSYAKSCSDCSRTNGVCAQKNNYVMCSCKSGMIGNGLTCMKAVSCNSYQCCPRGYVWDQAGKKCLDINECSQTSLNKCSPSSTCQNLNGVYLCTNINKAPCLSDSCPDDLDCLTINGTAQCADPCSNYEELNGDSRLFTIDSTGRFLTDRYNIGWYRYTGSIAVGMKEGCVGALKCGSLEPYSLGGPHPNSTEGVKMVPLLINGLNGCLTGSSIPIKACPDGFYVYKFTGMLKFDVYCTDAANDTYITNTTTVPTMKSSTATTKSSTANSTDVSITTRDPGVIHVTISKVTKSSAFVEWIRPLVYFTYYNISVTGNPSSSYSNTTENFTVTNLTPGNYYIVTVSAINGFVTVSENSTSFYTVPDAIQNLIISNITTRSISLTWSQPMGNRSSYEVLVSGKPSPYLSYSESYFVEGLEPGNYYTFTVSAKSGDNQSGDKIVNSTYTKPERVTNLTVSNITIHTVTLSWMAPEGNRSSYFIEVLGNSRNNYSKIQESVIIGDLNAGVQYTFRVCALSGENTQRGQCSDISAATHSRSLTVSLVYYASVEQREGKITDQIYSIIQGKAPNQKVTVDWKNEKMLEQ